MAFLASKYTPEKMTDIVNQKIGLTKIIDFLENFSRYKKNALIIHGPSGSGKTCSIYAIAKDLDYDIVELNSDDLRNKDQIQKKLGSAMMMGSLFGKKKMILVDEVESFSRKDHGGLGALSKLLKDSKFPVILIALDLWNQKLSSIKYYCESAEYKKIHSATLKKYLKLILDKEGITYDTEVIDFIGKNSDGDLRLALNDLSTLIAGKTSLTIEDIMFIEDRPKEGKIFNIIQEIFKSTSINEAKKVFNNSNLDFDTVKLWLNENITNEFLTPNEYAKAYDKASRSDVFVGRIRRRMSWSLYKYVVDLEIAGIASAKVNTSAGFTRYQPPSKLTKMSRSRAARNTVKEISLKIAHKTHTSSRVARSTYVPMLKRVFKGDKKLGKKIAEQVGLDKDEIKFLAK